MSRRVFALPALWFLAGCFDPPRAVCTQGALNCACANGLCEEGLDCRGGMCVADEHADDGEPHTSPTSSESGNEETSGTSTSSTSANSVIDETTGSTTSTSGTTEALSTSTSSTSSDPSTSSSSAEVTAGAGTSGDTGDASTGPIDTCGDGVLDPDEACDSTPGCREDCTLEHYECNPLNNAPCRAGTKCSSVEIEEGDEVVTVTTQCLPFSKSPPGQLHEGNCFEWVPHDEWCDLGLACALVSATDACADTNCCVEYCDLDDPSFVCAFAGDACVPYWYGQVPPGLERLGFCARP